MDKNPKEILAEIESSISELKSKISDLESKLELYRSMAAEEAAPAGPVDLSAQEIGEFPDIDDLPEPEAEDLPEDLPEVEATPEKAPQPEPAPEVEDLPAAAPQADFKAVAETVYAMKPRWKSDLPGASVKNIRSAISLYDRALFINTLFKEDYSRYDATVSRLNEMTGLDEAVAFIATEFPDWDLASDAVYGFMMAVRKKLG